MSEGGKALDCSKNRAPMPHFIIIEISMILEMELYYKIILKEKQLTIFFLRSTNISDLKKQIFKNRTKNPIKTPPMLTNTPGLHIY